MLSSVCKVEGRRFDDEEEEEQHPTLRIQRHWNSLVVPAQLGVILEQAPFLSFAGFISKDNNNGRLRGVKVLRVNFPLILFLLFFSLFTSCFFSCFLFADYVNVKRGEMRVHER